MGEVVEFTGGRRCGWCDEQISPVRLRLIPDADLCTICQVVDEKALEIGLSRIGAATPVVIRRER